ncbi:hypothetical protein I0C86_22535 [Plantactinospora sp. S1510]|uniref:Uncharacterized protein n=1 Tax=Plantactinospora alkalitolerans TaxID=2789879 RepID=A0ABS0GZS4_9ACTN|nr:hypothetical protein [Plantactinospora alkalitolerans]MBF9131718.1 hypothetical protein [Plantactinospora alkalitolerans]
MFGFGGRRSRRKLAKAELGESLDHLMRAATHAASGVGAAVGPRADAARAYLSPTANMVRQTASDGWESTMTRFAPLAVAAAAAADGARQAGSVALKARSKKMKAMRKKNSMMRRRWPMLTGLLVAGAVAGAMGAAAMRRRGRQPWDEYDPAATLDAVRDDAASIMGSSAGGSGREPASPKSSPTERAKDRTAAAGEKLATTTAPISESTKKVGTKNGDRSDGLLGAAATPSRNSGS